MNLPVVRVEAHAPNCHVLVPPADGDGDSLFAAGCLGRIGPANIKDVRVVVVHRDKHIGVPVLGEIGQSSRGPHAQSEKRIDIAIVDHDKERPKWLLKGQVGDVKVNVSAASPAAFAVPAAAIAAREHTQAAADILVIIVDVFKVEKIVCLSVDGIEDSIGKFGRGSTMQSCKSDSKEEHGSERFGEHHVGLAWFVLFDKEIWFVCARCGSVVLSFCDAFEQTLNPHTRTGPVLTFFCFAKGTVCPRQFLPKEHLKLRRLQTASASNNIVSDCRLHNPVMFSFLQ